MFSKSELQRARQTAERLLSLIQKEEDRQARVEQAAQTVRQSFVDLEAAVQTLSQ